MSIRAHAPYLVPGWEMCLPSINPLKELLWMVQQKKQGYRRERHMQRIIRIPSFSFKDTFKMVLHANKGNH